MATTNGLGQAPVDLEAPAEGDRTFWSVTTIMKCLDTPAFQYWAAEETAKAALRNERSWQAIREEQGDEEAIRWLTGARFRKGKGARTATELGEEIHKKAEQWVLTGQRPKCDREVTPFLDRFGEWLDRFQPSYEAAEVVVYDPQFGYAGTLDAILIIDGVRAVADYKTSRTNVDRQGKLTTPYSEVSLQLAAYRFAEFAAIWRPRRTEVFRRRYYLLSDAERAQAVPVPEVDGGLCIFITPERCEAYVVRCDRAVHMAFLYVLEADRKSVV